MDRGNRKVINKNLQATSFFYFYCPFNGDNSWINRSKGSYLVGHNDKITVCFTKQNKKDISWYEILLYQQNN